MDGEFNPPNEATLKTASIEADGQAMEDKGAVVEHASEEVIPGDVNNRVSEGLVHHPAENHLASFRNCTVNGEPFPAAADSDD